MSRPSSFPYLRRSRALAAWRDMRWVTCRITPLDEKGEIAGPPQQFRFRGHVQISSGT